MSEMHKAFVTAYADMANPKKNANNPAFRSKYANLEEVLNVTRPLLAASGFALVQEPVSEEGGIGVHTQLIHESGETLDFGYYIVPLVKHDAQGAGSAITYCRRYAVASIFGLAQEDDDGNAASKPQATAAAKPQPEVKAKPQAAPKGTNVPEASTDPDEKALAAILADADKHKTKLVVWELLGKGDTHEKLIAAYKAMDDTQRVALRMSAKTGAVAE